jgi:hypothetical protein
MLIGSRSLLLASSVIVFATLSLAGATAMSSSGTQAANTVAITIPVNQGVVVSSPLTSNFTVLSASGQGYTLQTEAGLTTNVLTFTPTNATQFSILVNVTANGPNYAYVMKQSDAALEVPACSQCNFTSNGSVLLRLNINATSNPASSGTSWDPLFGMLPLRLHSVSLSFFDVLAIMMTLGSVFLAIGVVAKSKVAYLGVVILFLVGAVEFGLLVMLGLVGIYLLSFSALSLYWRYRSWRTKG